MVKDNLLPAGLHLEQMVKDGETLIVNATINQQQGCCPKCQAVSAHIHSRYIRVIKDLPCFGETVLLKVQTHRFFCLNLNCQQRIFCQRLSTVVSAHARFSLRLNEIISFIGLANGGQMGSRLAARLSISVSPDTLLRRIRSLNSQPATALSVRVVGIDDWALRKGQRYGTILIDLERHCPIDLLPDRTSETVTQWLKQHPEIEIISRDRANAYIDAANKGAPQAIQVADRFHLLQNLTDAIERFLKCRNSYLKEVVQALNAQPQLSDEPSNNSILDNPQPIAESIDQPGPLAKQDLRYERYLQVKEYYQQGASIQTIAKHFGMHRRTVRLFISAQTYPELAPRPLRGSMLDRHIPYLERRWQEGCHNATQLWRELKTQGHQVSRPNVSRYIVMKFREEKPLHIQQLSKSQSQQIIPSTRNIAFLFSQKPADVPIEKQPFIIKLCEIKPDVQLVYNLAQSFSQMVREKKADPLEQWIKDAIGSEIAEIVGFAEGLRREQASITAALSLPWSNGPVEGTVHKLKLLKRQMYGRAKLDLLRQRLLNSLST